MAWADWTDVVAVVTAFGVAAVTTPAGVSGAVLLPPFQASVLDTPVLAIAPTNLAYNIISTPERCTGTGGRGRPAGG